MSEFHPHLLIADSDAEVRQRLSMQAEGLGLSYLVANCAEEALALARTHRPCVVILDLSQHMEARDLLAALKKDPSTAHIEVVVLSDFEDQFTRHVCFDLGARDYALKPFDHLFLRRVARMTGLDQPPAQIG